MVATAAAGVGIVDSKTYIFGRDSELLVFDSDKSLKPVPSSSSTRPPPRQSASLLRIDSTRLLLSGGSSEDTANTPLADNWVFDLSTSIWTQIANLASGPRINHQSVVIRPVTGNYLVHVGGQGASAVIEYSAIPPPGSIAWAWKPVGSVSSLSGITSPSPLLAIQDQLLIFHPNLTFTVLKLTEPTPSTLAFTPVDSYTPPPTSSPSILEQASGPVSATTIIIVAGVCVGIIGLVFVLGIVWYQRQHPHDTAPLAGMFRAHDGAEPLSVSLEPLALPRQPLGPGARRARSRTNSLPAQPVPTAWALPPRRRTISTGRKVTFQLPHAHSEPDLHVPKSPVESDSSTSPQSLSASAPLLSSPDMVKGDEPMALKFPSAAAVTDSAMVLPMDQQMPATTTRADRKCKRSVSWHASTGVHDREAGAPGRPVLHASDVDEPLLEEPLLVRRVSSPVVSPPAEEQD
ncbi:hypothetical protein BCR44DRAFT_59918 [Catenaria anguillulae PL171]|uniref:Galactose oxidase n=1 Tax=Catenaria anguillulae PL171 TaxID=765915 RepID=A0A1Y2HU86_9FUNG|nr:hypothetical protein BCR44DRAFT_59918 [Catenaria anguillulae PL171]